MHKRICKVLCISTGAVHRYYESHRRLFNNTKPGRAEQAQKAKTNAKKRTLNVGIL